MGSLLRLIGLHRFKMTWMKQVKLMMQYYKQLGMCFHQNHVPIESIQQERVLCPQETVPWTLWTFTESSPNKKPFTTHPNKNHMSCCCEKPACFFFSLPSVFSTRKTQPRNPPHQKKSHPNICQETPLQGTFAFNTCGWKSVGSKGLKNGWLEDDPFASGDMLVSGVYFWWFQHLSKLSGSYKIGFRIWLMG